MLLTVTVMNLDWNWITVFTGSWGYSTAILSATLISFLRKTVSFYVVLLHVVDFMEGKHSVKKTDCITDRLTSCIKTPSNPKENLLHFQILNLK